MCVTTIMSCKLIAALKYNTKKVPTQCGDFNIMVGLVETSYFLLTVPAAGDDPEINTDNTDLNKRIRLKDGL